jgi:hypothetical protein
MATLGTGDWGAGIWGGIVEKVKSYANIARRKAKAVIQYITRKK